MNLQDFHPECQNGEVLLGNVTKEGFLAIEYATKRLGLIAYNIRGEKIEPSEMIALYPVFAAKCELLQ